jgi:hypothetical protein
MLRLKRTGGNAMSSKIVARSIFLFAVLVVLLLAPRGAYAAGGTLAGFVEELERTVTATRNGRGGELVKGSSVNTFDIIETGLMGYAIIRLIDGTIIELAPNSAVCLVDVTFTPDVARLHIEINRGDVRVRTGSIGLKNPLGLDITTPRSVVAASNCELIFSVGEESEVVNIIWMPKGPKVSVFNVGTGDLLDIRRPQVAVMTDIDNNMTVNEIGEEETAEEDE